VQSVIKIQTKFPSRKEAAPMRDCRVAMSCTRINEWTIRDFRRPTWHATGSGSAIDPMPRGNSTSYIYIYL